MARKMINPYFFIDKALQVGFNFTLDIHDPDTIHAKSLLTFEPNSSEIEIRYAKKILKELAAINTKILNQYMFKHQTVFSARFDKQDADGQILDEMELFNNLGFNQF